MSYGKVLQEAVDKLVLRKVNETKIRTSKSITRTLTLRGQKHSVSSTKEVKHLPSQTLQNLQIRPVFEPKVKSRKREGVRSHHTRNGGVST